MTFQEGEKKRFTGTFTVAGVETDPGDVTVQVQSPIGDVVEKTYGLNPTEVVKQATGIYYYDVAFTMGGEWIIRFEGTTPVVSAWEQEVFVESSRVDA